MEKIGTKDLVFSREFIVPENESVFFDTHIEGWLIKFQIVFLIEPGKSNEINIIPEGDILKINLTNWNNSLGTATISPIRIGTHSNGKALFTMFACHSVGKTNIFLIQLLLGGQDGK